MSGILGLLSHGISSFIGLHRPKGTCHARGNQPSKKDDTRQSSNNRR